MTADGLVGLFADERRDADSIVAGIEAFLSDHEDVDELVDAAIGSPREVVHAAVAYILSKRSRPRDFGPTCRLTAKLPMAKQLGYTLLTALSGQILNGARPTEPEASLLKQILQIAIADREVGIVSGTAVELLAAIAAHSPDVISSLERQDWWRRIQKIPLKVQADWSPEIDEIRKAWSISNVQ